MWSLKRVAGGLGLVVALAVNTGCLNPHARSNWLPISLNPPPSPSNSAPIVSTTATTEATPPAPRYRQPTPFAADKSPTPVPDNRSSGEAASQVAVTPVGHVESQPPLVSVPPLPMPRPDGEPQPSSTRLTHPSPAGPGQPGPTVNDPHRLTSPTNFGAILGLRPGELPMDRALEMTRRLEQCVLENQVLSARINTLMAEASAREHALNEGIRDVRRAAEEIEKTRSDLAQARKDMDALRERMKRMEAEEIETLNTVIDAIKKLIRNQNEVP